MEERPKLKAAAPLPHSARADSTARDESPAFRDAAPLAFRHLREHFGVSAEDYMLSICGENNLRELGTPGKSGAVFYLTEDGKYMIKTVSRKESKFLRKILPNYYCPPAHSDRRRGPPEATGPRDARGVPPRRPGGAAALRRVLLPCV